MPKICSGYCTIGTSGSELKNIGNEEQLFGIGAQQRAGIGAHRGFPADFPRQHLLLPGGTVPPVS